MNRSLRTYLELYRKSTNFIPRKWIDSKCKVFSEYLTKNKLTGAVVSVSGGVDSAVTLGLCLETMKQYPDVLKKVVPIAQPIHSSDWAVNRAQELCNTFNVPLRVINQTSMYDQLKNAVDMVLDVKGGKFSGGQLRSYMRTPVNYYVAQLLTESGFPAIVMGTGNRDEDGHLAYFCKAGDGVVDLQLLAFLHKYQVFQVGRELGVPDSILSAQPSADLWDGQTDEDEMGISYDAVELYVGYYLGLYDDQRRSEWENELDAEAKKEWLHIKDRCETIHNRNKHKLVGVVNL